MTVRRILCRRCNRRVCTPRLRGTGVRRDHFHHRTGGGQQWGLSIVLALNGVPAGGDIDTDSATAQLEGQPLDVSVDSATDTDTINQTTLLVMDTSDSMAGEKLDSAKERRSAICGVCPR